MLTSAGSGPELSGTMAASVACGSRWQPAAPARIENPSERTKRNRGPDLSILLVSSYLLIVLTQTYRVRCVFPLACDRREENWMGYAHSLTIGLYPGRGPV